MSMKHEDECRLMTPFGDMTIFIKSMDEENLQKLRDIVINFYEGLATMFQDMGDEVSTYGFYREDLIESTPTVQTTRKDLRDDNSLTCRNYNCFCDTCKLTGIKCQSERIDFSDCVMNSLV